MIRDFIPKAPRFPMTQTEAARCGCISANQFYQRHGFTPNGESDRAIYYIRTAI